MTHLIHEGPVLNCSEGSALTHQIVETIPEFQPTSAPIVRTDARQRCIETARDRRSGSGSDTKLCAAYRREIYYRRQADLCERIAHNTAQQALADELMRIAAEFRAASVAFSDFRKTMGRGAESPCNDCECSCLRHAKRRKPE
jgi:hypothetical protein